VGTGQNCLEASSQRFVPLEPGLHDAGEPRGQPSSKRLVVRWRSGTRNSDSGKSEHRGFLAKRGDKGSHVERTSLFFSFVD
jgi:hypothetical protein